MTASQPLVTPEELQCLLGWPLPAAETEGTPSAVPVASTPTPMLRALQAPAGLAMAG